jgi:hypothetical protein
MSDHLITEAATYTTHNKHNRQTSMPSAEFEPMIPEIKQPQTYTFRLQGHWDWCLTGQVIQKIG